MTSFDVLNAICRQNLEAFTCKAFGVIEPGTEFEYNWHLGCISEHLEALYNLEIQDLIINIAPRTLKSVHVAQIYPAWVLGKDPSHQFINASYAHTLAERNVMRTRQIINSEWYQQLFDGVEISADQNQKDYFTTTKAGQYKGTGIGGTITGFGCNSLLIDDPINPKEAVSDTIRLNAISEIRSTLFSRFNEYKKRRFCMIMQRLHDADPTGDLMKDGGYTVLKLPAYAPQRIQIDFRGKSWGMEEGSYLTPRLDKEALDKLKVDLGTYHFCTPKESPILMADLSLKPIGKIEIGDKVIGFTTNVDAKKEGERFSRRHLEITEIKDISKSIRDVVKVTLDSGKVIRCTPDHRWYTKRSPKDKTHKMYDVAKIGRALMRVCDPDISDLAGEDLKKAGWLAGFFDADGSAVINNKNCLISFTQGTGRNLLLCEKLEETLTHFGFTYNYDERIRSDNKSTNHKIRTYYLTGDTMKNAQKLLHVIGVSKWRDRIERGILCSGFIKSKEKVVSIEPDGEDLVYGLTTTTGNYIVWGLASSNSGQYMQEPIPIGGGEFKEEWIQLYNPQGIKPREMNLVILCDPAGGEEINKKKRKLSDWSVFDVIGLAPDNNYYWLDGIRDRLNPTERVETLFMLHRKWNGLTGKPPKVGYEKYGMMTDTHYIKEKQNVDAYHFPLVELGGAMQKEERIRRLIPDMENGRWYFPQSLLYIDGEGLSFDLVKEFLNEMSTFPRARHDDLMDAKSRIYEKELNMVFPRPKAGIVERAARSRSSGQSDWRDF